MSIRRIKRYFTVCLFAIAVAAIAWIAAAGPVTVYRTVVYNFSDIEDYRIFPQQRLTAAAEPFRFREGNGKWNIPTVVSFGARRDAPLSELLPRLSQP